MKPIRLLTCLGLSLSTGLSLSVLLPAAASATTYTNGRTTLVLNERTETPSGFYYTLVNGRQWRGDVTISQSDSGAGHTFYRGRFRDTPIGPVSRITCEGDIQIVRRNIPTDRSPGAGARVTWNVTGGQGCNSIGQKFELSLEEPLPVANSQGDFTPANSNTWQSETAGLVTWPSWRVVSSDGELNCRTAPNGAVKTVYRAGVDQISAETRGGNALVFSNGAPWMLTRQACYVRANARYMQPISIPH